MSTLFYVLEYLCFYSYITPCSIPRIVKYEEEREREREEENIIDITLYQGMCIMFVENL